MHSYAVCMVHPCSVACQDVSYFVRYPALVCVCVCLCVHVFDIGGERERDRDRERRGTRREKSLIGYCTVYVCEC